MDDYCESRVEREQSEYTLYDKVNDRDQRCLDEVRSGAEGSSSEHSCDDEHDEGECSPDQVVYDGRVAEKDVAASKNNLDKQHHPNEVRDDSS